MAARKRPAPEQRLNREDPDEAAWQSAWRVAHDHNLAEIERFQADVAEARRTSRAGARVTVKLPKLHEAPPLPDFGAHRPGHARRELLGRYLHDRDANVVHDCYRAVETCVIDEIRNGTFIHFGGELDGALPDDATACDCMAAED